MNSILIGGGSKKALYLSWETLAQAQAEGMTESQILSEIRNTAALFLNSVPGRSGIRITGLSIEACEHALVAVEGFDNGRDCDTGYRDAGYRGVCRECGAIQEAA